MRLWRIEGNELHTIESRPLHTEGRIEEWLAEDITMVSDDLLVIGRQVQSGLGGILDLLAIDGNGDLAVLELKRDLTPRNVVAQALHYAAWVRTLGWDEIDELAAAYCGGGRLVDKFQERFGRPVPDTVNSAHRIYIVAAEMDPVSEAIVRYLSEEYSVGINVVFFRYFRDADGSEYIGHSWLMEPSQVYGRGEGRVAKRRQILSVEELERRADERGLGDVYRRLFAFFSTKADRVNRTQSNVAFAFRVGDATSSAFSMYPDRSSDQVGLFVDVRPDYLAQALGLPEEQVRIGLPGAAETDAWAYGEVHFFRTMADVDKLINTLSAGTSGETPPS